MTIQECYASFGGDFNDVQSRLLTEERIAKVSVRFLDDPTMKLLEDSIASKNYEEAFRAAHTLKGVTQNLSFTPLYQIIFDMTETLRPGNNGDMNLAAEQLKIVKEKYKTITAAISEFKAQL